MLSPAGLTVSPLLPEKTTGAKRHDIIFTPGGKVLHSGGDLSRHCLCLFSTYQTGRQVPYLFHFPAGERR
jgi:hypothetical protein